MMLVGFNEIKKLGQWFRKPLAKTTSYS